MTDDRDAASFRVQLLHQAGHALLRLAHAHSVPEEVLTEAEHLLQCQILKRFKIPEDAEHIRFMASYLNEAARNALRRAYRKRRRRVRLTLFSDVAPAEMERLLQVPEELERRHLSFEEVMAKVAEGLEAVTPGELRVLELLRKGYRARVIADVLGISVDSVYALASTGRKKIREVFRKKDSA